jgi:16S rRNA (guanine1207-N2)-methyltransferase
VNQRAVDLSRKNLKLNGVEAEVFQGDGFENVPGSFDCVITNPPIRAGKQAIYAMFAEACNRLNPGGALYIVIRKQQGAPSALKYLKEVFGEAEVVDRGAGFWVIRADKA